MSKWFGLALVGAAALAALHACNSGEPPLAVPVSAGPGNEFGAEGGVVQTNSITVEIPAGALSQPVEIRVTETFEVAVPEGLILLGPAFDLEPDGTQFSKPVGITIAFSHNLGSSDPVLYHASEGEDFVPVADSTFDPTTNVLHGSITHFSFVAPFVTRSVDAPPDAGSLPMSDGGAGPTANGGSGGGDDPASGGESTAMGGAPASGGAPSTAGAGGDPCGCCCGLICLNGQCVDPGT